MTCILTFAVDSVRISSDIPIQSDYVPKITIYFVLSFFYNLFSIVWFKIYNYMGEKKSIPWILANYCDILRCTYMRGLLIRSRKNKVEDLKDKTVKDQFTTEEEFEINMNILNRSVLILVALCMTSGIIFLIIN
jgi:hypothetical protein